MGKFEDYIKAHKNWSTKTFGDSQRTLGIVKHIKKELEEILADPEDFSEWIDVIILAIDGYLRSGGEDNKLFYLLLLKQRKNMAREWPKNSEDDEPTHHIEQRESGSHKFATIDKNDNELRCITSLHCAIQDSGGKVSDEYMNMTVKDFIYHIASPNNIKFEYSAEVLDDKD